MTMGSTDSHDDIFSSTRFCEARLGEGSIFGLLHREGHRLFPDECFADLFVGRGRRSVPPRVVATVMVLQRIEGLSDREAVERLAFDLRWKYAAGGLPVEHESFVHTVLVDMRERLRASERPDRIFDAVLEVAKSAGLVGRKRVLDSTALYDAVATQDTVTMIRSAIRGVLRVADAGVASEVRQVLVRDDDYIAPGKPTCEWDDAAAREALVDALARDGFATLVILDGRDLSADIKAAGELLATVLGQDLEEREDGLFRIARRVAPDRVISTVDPEARHGHKTSARGFDGYKGHIAVDPDTEIITATAVTAGNVADGEVALELVTDVLPVGQAAPSGGSATVDAVTTETAAAEADARDAARAERPELYGDACYGTADNVEQVEQAGADCYFKVQPPSTGQGLFSKEAFTIDLAARSVQCPAGVTVPLRAMPDGSGLASFGKHCAGCSLRDRCTASKTGRHVRTHPKERVLQGARERGKDPERQTKYRTTRPKVERKIAHLMRRRHGGRRARVRGKSKVGHDFSLLAAGVNLSRLAILGLSHRDGAWRL